MPLLDVLAEWNPWWRSGTVPDALHGRPRHLTAEVLQALPHREVIALTGVRRSGKTTLLYQLVRAALGEGWEPRSILMVNLEDPALAGVDLDAIVQEHRRAMGPETLRLLILDEVQEVKGWEAWVNVQYERRSIPKMAVTGSSMMRGDLARLLTGRNLTYTVRPLTYKENLDLRRTPPPPAPWTAKDRDALLHGFDAYLQAGGFPAAVLREPEDRRRLLQQYFLDILSRDLAHRRGTDLARIERFAAYVADTAGRPQTGRALGRATDLAPDTARAYLGLLEEVFLVRTVTRFAWSPKPALRERAPFKVYLCDPGLRDAVASAPGRDQGRLAEAVVANALLDRRRGIGYWTDAKGKHEVDFVVPRIDGRLDAYQVTYGEEIPARETAALHAFQRSLPPDRRGILNLLTRATAGEVDGVAARPVWAWLLDAGR